MRAPEIWWDCAPCGRWFYTDQPVDHGLYTDQRVDHVNPSCPVCLTMSGRLERRQDDQLSEDVMTTVKHADVSATLIQLADTLVSEYDVLDYLDLLLNRSANALDAEAGGVMLSNRRGELELLASTDEPARLMELYELGRAQGPSVECYEQGVQVIEEDLAASERWPRFTPAALLGGYRSAFAFPMRLREQTIGALNLFRIQPGGVGVDEVRAAQAFAHMAAIGILQERAVRESRDLARQMQTALNSRVVIEQAKGIIADRADLDLGAAYQRLRWYARNHNLTLRGVAGDVVAKTLPVEELEPQP